ncbi:hypothetical protein [Nostoc commune]|nr:hypothetical protein [Nostoc commune]
MGKCKGKELCAIADNEPRETVDSVNHILSIRCAYLNGLLAI